MLKQLILLLQIFSMSFVTFLLSDGVEVQTNLPSELKVDSTYIVEVVIKKGELFGFAKYQQNFPPGFDAKPVETSEASFTYADGKVKFIWMALPEQDEVKISYALTATAEAPAESIVSGKFSYIHENERKSYDIPNQTIAIITEEESVEAKLPATASVTRSVVSDGKNSFIVNLIIEKQGVNGFAKLEELLPLGAEAEVIDNKKSVFSQVDEKAKFVWMSIPEDEKLEISYRVKASADIKAQLESMEGTLAFLDEEETKSVPVVGSNVPAMAENIDVEGAIDEESEPISTEEDEATEAQQVVAESAPEATEVPIETKTQTENLASIEAAQQPKETDPQTIKTNQVQQPTQPQIANVPAPDKGVLFRVQIVAGHKVVDEAYLRKTYNFQEQFLVENHEGWIKYITGEFDVYKAARNKREALVAAQHNFPGPFVTAYNEGERITVQEALMITNQQWVQ